MEETAPKPKKKFTVKKILKLGLVASLVVLAFFLVKELYNLVDEPAKAFIKKVNPLPPSRIEYGIETNTYRVVEDTVERGQTFPGILKEHGVPDSLIPKITNLSNEVFNLKRFTAGKPLMVLKQREKPHKVIYLIYEHTFADYLVVDFRDTLKAVMGQKPIEEVESSVSCVVHSSVFGELEKKNANPELAVMMAQVFAWTIDFHKIQKEDAFKIVYEEQKVEGKSIGINRIKGAWFKSKGQEYFAFPYERNGSVNWYDEKGNSLKRMFLKAPLKFSRISSAYTLKRFHPVLKVFKAHLGTDYAAPTGTPILSVADGVVTDAKYNMNNGNYVKIKHNATYTTQYLHMSRIASGMRPGKRVRQGDVIGYVGSTGLATGPHLCFRFWKNGVQVDPKKEKSNQGPPLESKLKNDYLAKINSIQAALEKL
jgi:murein DD-endopeptidase MepM/ murein hydrolase activator NlpD